MTRPAPHADPSTTRTGPYRVLVVDPDRALERLVADAAPAPDRTEIVTADSPADAVRLLEDAPVDLAVIDSDLPDNTGIDFAQRLKRDHRTTHTVLVTHKPSVDAAVAAIRAGATDFILKPADPAAPGDFADRLRDAIAKQAADRKHHRRVDRLRNLCRKLNDARIDVSRQVDVLCHDLVDAYQELASQLAELAKRPDNTVDDPTSADQANWEQSDRLDHPGDTPQPMVMPTPGASAPDVARDAFEQLVASELDLEQLIRRTLEFTMQQTGPTNAAVFLPSSMDEFSLAGYVNYDCSRDAADLLLQHLGDVVAPKVADADGPLHLTDNDDITHWIGDDAAWLEDSHVVAFACSAEEESLAVVVLFRDHQEPFTPEQRAALHAVAPKLGDALHRVIRIHHRHLPDPDENEDWQDGDLFGTAF
ncbi:MAG: response regulator [Planctomycetota bacterium]